MANESDKVLGMAINSLVRKDCTDEVNELIKSCVEMCKLSVNESFKYLEEDVRPKVGEVLTRATMIDIMKSVDHIEDISRVEKVCGHTDCFKKARNFMKVSNPKFFDESRSKKREADRALKEKQKMISDMKKKYQDALYEKEEAIRSIYSYEDYKNDNDIWSTYEKYGK